MLLEEKNGKLVGEHKSNTIGINGKFSINGGDRKSPVDEAATYLA